MIPPQGRKELSQELCVLETDTCAEDTADLLLTALSSNKSELCAACIQSSCTCELNAQLQACKM